MTENKDTYNSWKVISENHLAIRIFSPQRELEQLKVQFSVSQTRKLGNANTISLAKQIN
jgi:hypothetical protein